MQMCVAGPGHWYSRQAPAPLVTGSKMCCTGVIQQRWLKCAPVGWGLAGHLGATHSQPGLAWGLFQPAISSLSLQPPCRHLACIHGQSSLLGWIKSEALNCNYAAQSLPASGTY